MPPALLYTLIGLAGASIPTSTALLNLMSAVLLVLGLAEAESRRRLADVMRMPVVWVGLTLATLVVIGCFWGPASTPEVLRELGKFRWLLPLPVWVALLHTPERQKALAWGLGAGVAIAVGASYLGAALGWPTRHQIHDQLAVANPEAYRQSWVYLQAHIYHNYFVGMVLYLIAAGFLLKRWSPRMRPWLMLAAAILLVNAFWMVQGRSGQILILVLAMVLIVQRFAWRGLLIGALCLAVLVPALYVAAPGFRYGVVRAANDLDQFAQGNANTSIGARLDFHRNSVKLMAEHPWLGVGTGSYRHAYQALTGYRDSLLASHNPHNDYLRLGVEHGIAGPLLLILWLVAAWRQLGKAETYPRWLGQALLASMAIASLGNSFFTDNVTSIGATMLLSALLYPTLRKPHDG
ncbi:O-antigen ligase [Chitinimonas sp. BJYL2]|uniref:O-antigen ligase family protein n=1 Tax=Chitinimonas sp. BJYL2 TaxID=2976696 RepID=UPI0022B430F6|nr:O-antigen ligase family protein [Chitinimonas sp. BJYL2]